MAVVECVRCGAKNRVKEWGTVGGRRRVCGRCGAGLEAAPAGGAGAKPETVTDASFESEVLRAGDGRPVLLDCWAAWCGPCRMVAPVLDELAAESAGRYRVAKLNVDENPRTAARLGVQSIPTLFIFRNGRPAERIVGAQPKHVLAARLSAHA